MIEMLGWDLEGLRRQNEANRAEIERILATVSATGVNWRPEASRWSVAECIDHLNVTIEHYLRQIEPAIARAREGRLTGVGPFPHGWLGRWFIENLEPPPKRRLRAPKLFRPKPTAQPNYRLDTLRIESQTARMRLEERIMSSSGLALDRIRVASPAFPVLKVHLGEAFAILAAHDRRHLLQARQIMERTDFPKGG